MTPYPRMSAAVAGAGVMSAVVAGGQVAVVIAAGVLAFALTVGALCWIIADAERATRLAMLVRVCRRRVPPEPARNVSPASRRRRA